MKKTTTLFALLCLIGAFSMVSCKKLDNGSHVDPITLYEKLKGNWRLNDVIQIDETAKIAGIAPDEISLYNEFDFESFNITLNVDGENRPSSYAVQGGAPVLFPSEGFWDLDNSFPQANGSPPVIYLYSDTEKTTLIGTLSVVSIPGVQAEMELKLTRSAAGVPFVSYHYKLSNANQ